jgi:ParB family chromosome partitioning protein
MSRLKDKAALVFGPRVSAQVEPGAVSAKPKTAIGAMAQFTDRQSAAIKEVAELKEKLQEHEGSFPTKQIDPNLIQPSKWANRHADSFNTDEFAELKKDIESKGCNVQPIKVSPIPGTEPAQYKIVFGHRRHRACLELGLPVLAMIESMTDKNLFLEMDRENRARADLRPYEIGAMYSMVLDEGMFSSVRKLAEEANIDQSQLTKALALARLPSGVLSAFVSPLDLQYRWVADLTEAIQKDPDYVLLVAGELKNESPRPASKDVFKRLTAGRGTVPHSADRSESFEGKSGRKGKFTFDAKKKALRINLAGIDLSRYQQVLDAVKKLM